MLSIELIVEDGVYKVCPYAITLPIAGQTRSFFSSYPSLSFTSIFLPFILSAN